MPISILSHCQSLNVPPGYAKPHHTHTAAQLVYVAEGAMVCESNAIRWHMVSRQIAWIPQGMEHNARALSPMTGMLLRIDVCQGPAWPETLVIANASQLLAGLMGRIGERSTGGRSAQVERLMAVLADEIASLPPVPQQLPLPCSTRLRKLAIDILSDLQDCWDLNETAVRYGFSRSTLTRSFSRETGMSFGRWLLSARMNAARLLIEDGEKVSEIAERVGYRTVSGFCAAFRQHFGVSPTMMGLRH